MTKSHAIQFQPNWFSKPADSILGLVRRRRMPLQAVANALGGMDVLCGLVRGTRAIDASLAASLASIFGGSASFWLKRQQNYEEAIERALRSSEGELEQWLRQIPLPGPRPRGRLTKEKKIEELRNRLVFYGVNNIRTWQRRYAQLRDQTEFRTSRAFSSDHGSVSLWLRRGELEAALTATEQWDSKKLFGMLGNIIALSKIRQPDRYLPRLKALGAEAGVAIVAVRAPQGCKASGAARFLSPDKAMVLLSFRHLSDDHFWFTLLHELGHLLLHGGSSFVDTDDTDLDEREQEANEFASSQIIPLERWDEFVNLHYDKRSVLRFGVSLGIAPGLIVGQLQHRGMISRDRLNFLKRRWTWAQIDDAIVTL